MKLDGQDKKILDLALVSAFSEYEKLNKMVRYQLNKELEEIVGKGKIDDVVFALSSWAEKEEKVKDLIEGACKENPSNQKLKSCRETIFSKYFPYEPDDKPTYVLSNNISPEQKSELIVILANINSEILQITCRATLKSISKDIEEDFPQINNEWKNLRPLQEILLEKFPLRKDNIPTIVEFAERLNKAKELDESEKNRIQQWLEKIVNEKNINLPTYVDEPELDLTEINPHLLITIEQLPENFCLQAELIFNYQQGKSKPGSLPIYSHQNELICSFNEIENEVYKFIQKAKNEIAQKYRYAKNKLSIELFYKVKHSGEDFDLEKISLDSNELKKIEYQYQFTVSCLEEDLINQNTNFGEFLNQFLTRWDLFKAFLQENSTNKNKEYQEVEGSDFQKIDNLYSRYAQGSIVKDPRMFYGRDQLINNWISSIRNSPSAKNFILYGQKCTGKSSILYHLEQKLKPQIIPVRFNIGGMDNFSDTTFLYRIIQEMEETFHQLAKQGYPSISVERPDIEEMRHHAQIIFDDYMSDLRKNLRNINEYRNAKLMLLIDDFSYVYGQIMKGFVSDNFMQFWKALLEKNYFGTVLVGQDNMPRFINSFPNEFQIAESQRISYLEKDSACKLIVNPILTERGESRYQEKAVNKLIELTAGSPYYIQIFCNRLVDYMNREKIVYVSDADIERVKEELITENNLLESADFDNLISAGDDNINNISKEDIEAVLRDIANKTKQKDYCDRSSINTNTLIPVDEILKDLETREVIEKQDNSYKIKVGLFKEWLLEHLTKINSNNSFEESIVSITSDLDKKANVIGTGFAFYREQNFTYLLTCAHVVEDMGGENNVLVNDDFPAEIVAIGNIKGFDLAVLRVAELDDTPLLKLTTLSPQIEKDLKIKICGNYLYSEEKKMLNQTVEGIIETSQKIKVIQSAEKVTVWKLQIQKGRLEKGYSGAPVVDSETGLVLGVTTNKEGNGEQGAAISIEAVRKIWPEIPLEGI